MRQRGAWGLTVLFCVAACANGDEPSERLATDLANLHGGDTHDVQNSTGLPEAAIGQIVIQTPGANQPRNGCTATVIQTRGRTGGAVVLSAAHCFCGSTGLQSSLPGVPFSRPDGIGGVTQLGVSVSTAVKFFGSDPELCSAENDSEISDLSILILNNDLTGTVAGVPLVYTGSDFVDRLLNSTMPFLVPPRRMTSARNLPVLEQGSLDGVNIQIEQPCDFFGSCRPFHILISREQGGPILDGGDSGGPLTFDGTGGKPFIFAVASNISSATGVGKGLGFSDIDFYSPTFENGNGNGQFIQQFFTDGDQDGVDDAVDNCAPSLPFCVANPFLCSNPSQADDDGDGIGDACDNCPGTVCTARNWPNGACANPDQQDFDGDGTGNACDLCPFIQNGNAGRGDADQFLDGDRDGVPDACDDCRAVPADLPGGTSRNGFRPCTSANDCKGETCYDAPLLGRCSLTGDSCAGSVPCPLGITANICVAGFGRCPMQFDDLDGDGLGGACDLCEGVNDTRINVSSNLDAEVRQSAQIRGDLCEGVPQFVSRANLGISSVGGPQVQNS